MDCPYPIISENIFGQQMDLLKDDINAHFSNPYQEFDAVYLIFGRLGHILVDEYACNILEGFPAAYSNFIFSENTLLISPIVDCRPFGHAGGFYRKSGWHSLMHEQFHHFGALDHYDTGTVFGTISYQEEALATDPRADEGIFGSEIKQCMEQDTGGWWYGTPECTIEELEDVYFCKWDKRNIGLYDEPTLKVILSPQAAINDGAMWRLTTGSDTDWHESGEPLFFSETDDYTIVFKEVAGWEELQSRVITIVNGVNGVEGAYERIGGEQTPWRDIEDGNLEIDLDLVWNGTMGYKFTPQTNGQITKLGGYFNGEKTVYLWDADQNLLGQTQVTSNNNWNYTSITPVNVTAGQTYLVDVYVAGSGASTRNNIILLPRTYRDIKIESTCYSVGDFSHCFNSAMQGQVDISFVPGVIVNYSPEITSGPTVTPNPVDEDKTSQVQVTASDPDNDILTYSWSATGGKITGNGNIVTYSPPNITEQTTYVITVIVSDGVGGIATGSVDVVIDAVSDKPVSPCSNYGDVNQDGFVTKEDAELILKHVVGNISLSVEQLTRADVNNDGTVSPTDSTLILDYVDGVVSTFAVCEPVVSKEPPCSNYGDVNQDGFVTKEDAELILKHIVGNISLSVEQLTRADVNNDGTVSPADSTLILDYVYGIVNTFSVCEPVVSKEIVSKSPPCSNYGDVNQDGFVTKEDVNMVLDHVVGNISLSVEQLTRADVNNDGTVSPADSTLILDYVDGVVSTFAVCSKTPLCGEYGDVNGDGYVTKADSDLILSYLAGSVTLTDAQKIKADVSNNGTVSSYDSALILQYTEGIIDTFSVCSVGALNDVENSLANISKVADELMRKIVELLKK